MLGVPGSDTVIYKGGREVFRYQSGFDSVRFRTPVRDNALYNLYSCSKVATCTAVMQLIERGEILVTDPIYAYFPEYRNIAVKHKNPDGSIEIIPAENPILIKHLLTMTAGLNYDLNSPAINRVKERTFGKCPTLDIVRALAEEPLEFEPGERFNYSLCHDVLGGLVELVSGMSFGEYMKQNIFEPLGMKSTSYKMTDDTLSRMATQYKYDAENKCAVEIPANDCAYRFGTEYESGGAGVISSVDDYILLVEALTHYGVGGNGNRILSKYGVNLMRMNWLDEKTEPTFNVPHMKGYSYGCGVRVNVHPEVAGRLSGIGEFGWDGAKCSYLSCDPENEISVFHAEHMGGLHGLILPRLCNLVYSCIGE